MKTKVNEWLTNLPKDERDHLLKPENRWQLCDRVWNEAIRQATNVVRENYDEQEPWMEPEDIEALYT